MTAPEPVPLRPTPLRPPTSGAVAWTQAALTSARALRQALNRLTIDHYGELTPEQQREVTTVRRQAATAVTSLSTLALQLELATGRTSAYTEADEAEARADLDYDAWKNR